MQDKTSILTKMKQAILTGDQNQAVKLAQSIGEFGLTPLEAIEKGFIAGIRQTGALWEEGELFLPELVTAAEAMKAAMKILQPQLKGETIANYGRVVIGTVVGDIHDIGKTLVATMLSANGFEVNDEGADVTIESFIEKAAEVDADLVCASALLTTTMTKQKELVDAVKEKGLRAKVLIGGAPVSHKWANEIQADGYASSAVLAVDEAKRLLGYAV